MAATTPTGWRMTRLRATADVRARSPANPPRFFGVVLQRGHRAVDLLAGVAQRFAVLAGQQPAVHRGVQRLLWRPFSIAARLVACGLFPGAKGAVRRLNGCVHIACCTLCHDTDGREICWVRDRGGAARLSGQPVTVDEQLQGRNAHSSTATWSGDALIRQGTLLIQNWKSH